jgi:hypothetical protein
MRKISRLILIALVLAGCDVKESPQAQIRDRWNGAGDRVLTEQDFFTNCIGGVVYYMMNIGHHSYFAPAYDPITKQVKICEASK